METLRQNARELLGIDLNDAQLEAFARFEQELLEWNERFNLTAIRDAEGIRLKHFLDSMTCMLAWHGRPKPNALIDIGTGAGLPGIALKIMLPELRLTLVESVGKKAEFCRHIVETLGLSQVTVVTGRAEDIGQDPAHREQYDWATARAVANLPVLAEYLLPLVRVGGAALAQKGQNTPQEVQTAGRAVQILGGRLRPLQLVHIPGIPETRYLVVMEKVAPTPAG